MKANLCLYTNLPNTLQCLEPLPIPLQLLLLLFYLGIQTGLIRNNITQHVFGLLHTLLDNEHREMVADSVLLCG